MHRTTIVVLATLLAACADGSGATDPVPEPSPAPASCAATPLTLAVGEAVLLPRAESHCLALNDAGAGYALAHADGRWVERAETAPDHRPGDDDFHVAVSSGPATDAAAGAVAGGWWRAGAREAAVGHAPAGAAHMAWSTTGDPFCGATLPADLYCRSEPWREGDRFTFAPRGLTMVEGTPEVEVRAVRDPLVFVAPVVGGEWLSRAHAYAVADSVLADFVPLLRESLTPTMPVTSAAAGQILVFTGVARGGFAYVISGPGGMRALVALTPALVNATTVGHELAHVWQAQFRSDTRASTDAPAGIPPFWAEEGGASFAQLEALRRAAGHPLDGNACSPMDDSPLQRYVRQLRQVNGWLYTGYRESASFLHHLRVRLVDAGVDEREAYREVLQGAIEGLHGLTADGSPRREGLTARMRRLLGPEWDPTRAMLEWAASAALDDRAPVAAFQNPTLCRAWDFDHVPGWRGMGELVVGQHGRIASPRPAMSAGWMLLTPGAGRGRLELEASSPAVRWLLVRYR